MGIGEVRVAHHLLYQRVTLGIIITVNLNKSRNILYGLGKASGLKEVFYESRIF